MTPQPYLQCRGLKKGRAIAVPTLRALVAYKGRTLTFYPIIAALSLVNMHGGSKCIPLLIEIFNIYILARNVVIYFMFRDMTPFRLVYKYQLF